MPEVEAREAAVATRRGKAVTQLLPSHPAPGGEGALGAAAAIRAMSRGVTLDGLPLRDLVAEGPR